MLFPFNFKDEYISASGLDILRYVQPNVFFFSPSYVGGNGSRTKPYRSNLYTTPNVEEIGLLFSSGLHKGTLNIGRNDYCTRHINGHQMGKTIVDWDLRALTSARFTRINLSVKDLTVKKMKLKSNVESGYGYFYLTFSNVEFYENPFYQLSNFSVTNRTAGKCIFRVAPANITIHNRNSFIGIEQDLETLSGSLHTFEKCNILITQEALDANQNNFYAFDNCKFRIGAETDYQALAGTTAEELRADFAARCQAAGLVVPSVYEDILDIKAPVGRWIFTKGQILEGLIFKGSEIDQFEFARYITFGHSIFRGEKISITSAQNKPASIAPIGLNSSNLVFSADSLSFSPNVDITKKQSLSAESKIIWLGGKQKLNKIDIPNNLPSLYGVLIDNTPNLLNTDADEVTFIEMDKMYIVQSRDDLEAGIKYNNIGYSSSLSTRNNIFRGNGTSSFTVDPSFSGTPVVYEISDILNYSTIQIRIVNKIPASEIASGSLQPDYWYFVDFKDASNKSGAIVYNGVSYGATDSFVAKAGALTYTPHPNLKVRRCWHKDFAFKDGIVDYDFWKNEQKPRWIDVLPEDPRCLMKNNSNMTIEMGEFLDEYVASGHPLFYHSVTEASGRSIPAYPIKGVYMQMKLTISTLNLI